MRYISKIKTLADDDPANALHVGTLMHAAIEDNVDMAAKNYYKKYPIIDDRHINEVIKVEYLASKVRKLLGKGIYEYQLKTDDFIGYIDYVEALQDGTFALYDFKYSNNVSNYESSAQIHLYRYFFEQVTGEKVSKLAYVMIPKTSLKQEYGEQITLYRRRLKKELTKKEPFVHNVRYSAHKVMQWAFDVKHLLEDTEYPKTPNKWCYFCEYKDYCEEGVDYMLLPANKRRDITAITKKTIWIYGAPFSGKTFLANQFPDPLMLNTDGNIKFVDSPYILIKNNVETEGRITKTTLAWEVFKDTISELEKKQNDFKTIVVDLLEDIYEHCRIYMYSQLGITHESDDSFRAWDKVRTEFLSTMKRLMNMDYENIILISHEDMSKDITKKSGDKITAIKPNINDKMANKIAGMVDLVVRAVAEENHRTLNFKPSDVVFGGGRLSVSETEIENDYDALMDIYDEANKNAVKVIDTPATNKRIQELKAEAKAEYEARQESKVEEEPVTEEETPVNPQPEEPQVEEEPGVRRRRRRRVTEEEA